MSNEKNFWESEITYPYQFGGCTVYKDKVVCNKCGKEVQQGIIPLSIHWDECIDGNKTLNALMAAREEKGNELTIEDIDKILPNNNR